MKYIFGYLSLLFFMPLFVFAQTGVSISSGVKIEQSESGRARFSYQVPTGADVLVRSECTFTGKFFIEKTGALVSCGETYTVPNAGEGGVIEIIPYEISKGGTATHILLQDIDGTQTEIARAEVTLLKQGPQPIFSQVSVRQSDPQKPEVVVAWNTLAQANVSLYLGCDSEELVLRDEQGDTFACQDKIASWQNADTGDMTFEASGFSTTEGLLFMFVAEQDDVVGAQKNISFTFETTTGKGTSETGNEQSVIDRLWAQVQTLLAVVAGLFR